MSNTQVAIDAVKKLFEADDEIKKLKSQRDELLLFAEQCAGIFNDYEIHHTNKGDETKAARNRCYKDMAESVIRKAKGEAND